MEAKSISKGPTTSTVQRVCPKCERSYILCVRWGLHCREAVAKVAIIQFTVLAFGCPLDFEVRNPSPTLAWDMQVEDKLDLCRKGPPPINMPECNMGVPMDSPTHSSREPTTMKMTHVATAVGTPRRAREWRFVEENPLRCDWGGQEVLSLGCGRVARRWISIGHTPRSLLHRGSIACSR